MSDQWQLAQQLAALRERVSVLETMLRTLQAELDRLSTGQSANRQYIDSKVSELSAAINTFAPIRTSSNRIFIGIIVIGALVSAVLILILFYWVYLATDGRLT